MTTKEGHNLTPPFHEENVFDTHAHTHAHNNTTLQVPIGANGVDENGLPLRKRSIAHEEHGPLIDAAGPESVILIPAGQDLWWSRVRHALREPFSEFFGVFILILFGDGVVAQVVLSQGTKGSYQSINWGWGYVFIFTIRLSVGFLILRVIHCSTRQRGSN
jgi:hypothetical protein